MLWEGCGLDLIPVGTKATALLLPSRSLWISAMDRDLEQKSHLRLKGDLVGQDLLMFSSALRGSE